MSDNDKLEKIIEQLYPNLKIMRDRVQRHHINKLNDENVVEEKEELEYSHR